MAQLVKVRATMSARPLCSLGPGKTRSSGGNPSRRQTTVEQGEGGIEVFPLKASQCEFCFLFVLFVCLVGFISRNKATHFDFS